MIYTCREPLNEITRDIEAFDPEYAAEDFAKNIDAELDYIFSSSGSGIVEVRLPDGVWEVYEIFTEPDIIYRATKKK